MSYAHTPEELENMNCGTTGSTAYWLKQIAIQLADSREIQEKQLEEIVISLNKIAGRV